MSNPTELPDLDKLEAMAKAADQDGHHIYTHPRDSNRAEENQMWQRAASPAAVLALIALARRAQPEGEAPQAELIALAQTLYDMRNTDERLRFRALAVDVAGPLLARIATAPAATLSPLCGAQHAESGKEVRPAGYLTPAQFKRLALGQVAEILPVESGGRGKTAVYFADQQAAAPAPRLSETKVWEAVKRHAQSWTIFNYAEFDREGLDAFAIELMDSQRAAQLDGGEEGSESNV